MFNYLNKNIIEYSIVLTKILFVYKFIYYTVIINTIKNNRCKKITCITCLDSRTNNGSTKKKVYN